MKNFEKPRSEPLDASALARMKTDEFEKRFDGLNLAPRIVSTLSFSLEKCFQQFLSFLNCFE